MHSEDTQERRFTQGRCDAGLRMDSVFLDLITGGQPPNPRHFAHWTSSMVTSEVCCVGGRSTNTPGAACCRPTIASASQPSFAFFPSCCWRKAQNVGVSGAEPLRWTLTPCPRSDSPPNPACPVFSLASLDSSHHNCLQKSTLMKLQRSGWRFLHVGRVWRGRGELDGCVTPSVGHDRIGNDYSR